MGNIEIRLSARQYQTGDETTHDFEVDGAARESILSKLIGPQGVLTADSSFDKFGTFVEVPEPFAEANTFLLWHLDSKVTFGDFAAVFGTDAVRNERFVIRCGGFGSTSLYGPLVLTLEQLHQWFGYPLAALGATQAWQLIRSRIYSIEYRYTRRLMKAWRVSGGLSSEMKALILAELRAREGEWPAKDFNRMFGANDFEAGQVLRECGLVYRSKSNSWVKRPGLKAWLQRRLPRNQSEDLS